MYCKQCGSYLEPNALTCPVCGAPAPEEPEQNEQAQPAATQEQHSASWEFGAGVTDGPSAPPAGSQARYQQAPPAGPRPEEQPEPPVKTLEWLWSLILTAIPIVNLVVLLIWSFDSGTSISKRNWARAKLILVAVSTVLSVIAIIVLVGIAVFSTGFGHSYGHYYYY